jgi:hypothetical protein
MQLRSSIHHRTRALCRDFLHRRTRGITDFLLNRRIEVEFPLASGLEFPAADQRIITNGTCALHAYGPNRQAAMLRHTFGASHITMRHH